MTKNLSETVQEQLDAAPTTKGPLGKLARKRKRAAVPANDDPRAELRRLVQEHKALVKAQTAIVNMASDKKNRETGEPILCRLPVDAQAELQAVAKAQALRADRLQASMLRELKKIPIYTTLLAHVFGLGPVVAAYIVALVDIHKATKISNLRRFCGLAVIGGRLERPTRGVKLAYCGELRMRLFQAFAAMWKNGAKLAVTSKYLDVWKNYKHRMQHSERIIGGKVSPKDGMVDGKIVNGQGKTVSARGFIHSAGWHKGADVLVEDIYTVWRALEGLPVWPSYHAAKLGYSHGGKVCVDAPKMLTVEEALAAVGDVGKVAIVGGVPEDVEVEEDPELVDAAE